MVLGICLCGVSLRSGEARIWSGPAAGDWGTAANWTPSDAIPQAGEDVVITGGSVLVTADTAELNSITLSNATIICSNWTTRLRATTVTIGTNGVVTLPAAFTNNGVSNRIYLVCADLTVAGGGRIDAWGKGYYGTNGATANGQGLGLGYYGRGGGGGHGGRGGFLSGNLAGGKTYGSIDNPDTPGSSGAGGGNTQGANGGGVVRIEASGAVLVDGVITVSGCNGNPWGAGMQSGCGAGGSIRIACAQLGGTGQILADGGTGAAYTPASGGGGGGGRIALHYGALSGTPTLRISAAAGVDGRSFSTIREFPAQTLGVAGYGWEAQPGTIFLADTNLLSSPVYRLTGYVVVSNLTVWNCGDLTVSNTVFGMGEGIDLNVAGNIQVTGTNAALIGASNGCDVICSGGLSLGNGGQLRLYGGLTCGGDILVAHRNSYVAIKGTNAVFCGGDLILTNQGCAYFHSGPTNGLGRDYGLLISMTGDVVLASNSWIYPYSDLKDGGSCRFQFDSVTIPAGSGFNADQKGFWGPNGATAYGLGPGQYVGGGGGYGGKGGGSDPALSGGPTKAGAAYGYTNAPLLPGSGGAGQANVGAINAAPGGGLIRLEVTGSLVLRGMLTADGSPAIPYTAAEMRAGCGAGGGIFVLCSSFSGNGILSAKGGTGEGVATTLRGGGGGGGRIAVGIGLSAADKALLLAGQIPPRPAITNLYSEFLGTWSVTNGIGYTNAPPGGAEPGTLAFIFYNMPQGTIFVLH